MLPAPPPRPVPHHLYLLHTPCSTNTAPGPHPFRIPSPPAPPLHACTALAGPRLANADSLQRWGAPRATAELGLCLHRPLAVAPRAPSTINGWQQREVGARPAAAAGWREQQRLHVRGGARPGIGQQKGAAHGATCGAVGHGPAQPQLPWVQQLLLLWGGQGRLLVGLLGGAPAPAQARPGPRPGSPQHGQRPHANGGAACRRSGAAGRRPWAAAAAAADAARPPALHVQQEGAVHGHVSQQVDHGGTHHVPLKGALDRGVCGPYGRVGGWVGREGRRVWAWRCGWLRAPWGPGCTTHDMTCGRG